MQTLASSILNTLAYFDLFSYPLLLDEIDAFLDRSVDRQSLCNALEELERNGQVFSLGSFFSIRYEPVLVAMRKQGNRRAVPLLKTAIRVGRLLYKFPFVRGVGISGSLSKNFADADADIDFFIITAPDRLWIARTLMHTLKKISFLFGRQHWLCLNYYISEDALVIAEKNIFTATEVVTLIPVCGEKTFDRFFAANNWTRGYYPNLAGKPMAAPPGSDRSIFKRLLETGFDNRFGNWLDRRWMQITTRRWLKKKLRHHRNDKGDLLALNTSRQTARPAPENFQKKVLDLYRLKLEQLGAGKIFAADLTD